MQAASPPASPRGGREAPATPARAGGGDAAPDAAAAQGGNAGNASPAEERNVSASASPADADAAARNDSQYWRVMRRLLRSSRCSRGGH